jgi:hypothetical protein
MEEETAGTESEDDDSREESGDDKGIEEADRKKLPARRGKNPTEGLGFDDFQLVTQKKHGDRKNHLVSKVDATVEQPVEVKLSEGSNVEENSTTVEGKTSDEVSHVKIVEKIEESGSEDAIDNEEEGGEWVTPDNLYKHIGSAITRP